MEPPAPMLWVGNGDWTAKLTSQSGAASLGVKPKWPKSHTVPTYSPCFTCSSHGTRIVKHSRFEVLFSRHHPLPDLRELQSCLAWGWSTQFVEINDISLTLEECLQLQGLIDTFLTTFDIWQIIICTMRVTHCSPNSHMLRRFFKLCSAGRDLQQWMVADGMLKMTKVSSAK